MVTIKNWKKFFLVIYLILFPSQVFSAMKHNLLVKGDYRCIQFAGKNYYSDGNTENIALSSDALIVKQNGNSLETYYEGSSYISLYEYHRGIAVKKDRSFMNFLYIPKAEETIFVTQSLSLLVGSHGIHVILTEPLTGNKRTFIRTSFYDCKSMTSR